MLDITESRRLSARLAEPYTIPADTPYLSDDQRDLAELPFEKRAEWMAQWLVWAQGTVDDESEYEWEEGRGARGEARGGCGEDNVSSVKGREKAGG